MTITQGSGLGVAMGSVHDDAPEWTVKRPIVGDVTAISRIGEVQVNELFGPVRP